MKVCIIGCGAIGSLYAAHLGKLDDVEVWAYDLNQAHVDAINENCSIKFEFKSVKLLFEVILTNGVASVS